MENIENETVQELHKQLAAQVYAHPVLYDKRNVDFHRKDVKRNTWREIAGRLRIKDDETAEKEWDKMRNKYCRLKREYREASAFGKTEGKKMLKRLEKVSYLSWVEEFIKPRQSRKGLKVGESKFSNIDSSVKNISISNIDPLKTRKRKIEAGNLMSLQSEEDKEDASAQRIVGSSHVIPRDEIEIFGELLVEKLRKLSEIITNDEFDDVQQNILKVIKNARKSSSLSQDRLPASGSFMQGSSQGAKTPGHEHHVNDFKG